MNIVELRKAFERKKGSLIQLQKDAEALKKKCDELNESQKLHEKAKEVIRAAGQKTQEQLSYYIGDITSLALSSVFDNPYELKVEFVQRRNKTECDLFFHRDGHDTDPLEGSGNGAADIAALALRIASWSMNRNKSNNTIILDEPLKFLSEDCQEKASAMIKEISRKLGIQFIVVSHKETLTAYADKVITVKKIGKYSRVK